MALSIIVLTVIIMLLAVITNATIRVFGKSFCLYPLVVAIGALALIAMGSVSIKEAAQGIFGGGSMNPVKILILFICMTGISVFLDGAGFFGALASFAAAKSGKSKLKLFIYLYVVVSVLTVFTSNDVIILTFTPFICYFAKESKTDPLPLLFCEFTAANTWSLFFIFGNPTNIYVSASLGIGFTEYFSNMWLSTLLCGVASFAALIMLFYKDLKKPLEKAALVERKPFDKPLIIIGITALFTAVVMMTVSDYIGVEMQTAAAFCFITLILSASVYLKSNKRSFKPLKDTFVRLPYSLIPFLISMFIIVLALEKGGYMNMIGGFLSGLKCDSAVYGISSYLAANVINNIPMSVMFQKIIAVGSLTEGAVYGTVIGSNLGALLTPVGALAGIMFTKLADEQGVKVGFLRFTKYGAMISIPALLIALAVL